MKQSLIIWLSVPFTLFSRLLLSICSWMCFQSSMSQRRLRQTSPDLTPLAPRSCQNQISGFDGATGTTPTYLNTLLRVHDPSRQSRSCIVAPSQWGKKLLSKTFSLTAHLWWKELPTSVWSSETITTFMKQLKATGTTKNTTTLTVCILPLVS